MSVVKVFKKNKLLVLVALTYFIVAIIVPEKGLAAIKNSGYYLFEMITVMPVVFLLTVFIDAWVPQDLIMKRLGEKSGVFGGLFSLLLGSLSAGPIYAAFPICKMLLKKGASIGNIIIILSSWAVIKVPMLANEAKFLGVKFMVVRWLLTVAAIFLMAWVSSFLIRRRDFPDDRSDGVVGLTVKGEYCIGCGLCARGLPRVFVMVDKKAVVAGELGGAREVDADVVSAIDSICEKCPVKAIVFEK